MSFQTLTANTAAKASAGALDGTELLRLVQDGAAKKLTIAALAAHMLSTLAFDPAGSAAAAQAASDPLGSASAAQAAAIASAAASLSAHANAPDPHPGYLTLAEAAAAFDALGAASAAQSAAASYTDSAISALRNGVSSGFDTLAELAAGKQDASANLTSWSALAPSAKQDAHANLTTLAALSSITPLTRLAASGETVTTSNPLLNLAQTWNAGGVTFTGLRFNATDSASASGSMLLDLQVAGSSLFKVTKAGTTTAAGSLLTTFGNVDIQSGSLRFGGSADAILARDAANILAQRNSTNAQIQRWYKSYTDASNYERLAIDAAANANQFRIMTERAGTGITKHLVFGAAGTASWYLDASSNALLCITDNTYDIGASGATRPRDYYGAGNTTIGGNATIGAGQAFLFSARSRIKCSADGLIELYNNAATDFSRLCFGGTTSSFPALKRNGSGLDVRFADDSGHAGLRVGAFTALTGNAISAGGNASSALLMSTTASFGVYFGSGAPTVSAAQGSLYLRSDGSGTGDRLYVRTASGWTAITTAS